MNPNPLITRALFQEEYQSQDLDLQDPVPWLRYFYFWLDLFILFTFLPVVSYMAVKTRLRIDCIAIVIMLAYTLCFVARLAI